LPPTLKECAVDRILFRTYSGLKYDAIALLEYKAFGVIVKGGYLGLMVLEHKIFIYT
jgi:hypothetical protein